MKNFYNENKSKLTRKQRSDLMIMDSIVHGSYFFSDKTMEFFGSEIVDGIYDNGTFVTSEDNGFDRSRKVYTARYYDWDNHQVITFYKSGPYDNLIEAINYALRYNPNDSSGKYQIELRQ